LKGTVVNRVGGVKRRVMGEIENARVRNCGGSQGFTISISIRLLLSNKENHSKTRRIPQIEPRDIRAGIEFQGVN